MTAYHEIMQALMFYIGTFDESGVREVLAQEYDSVALIADALDAYREYLAEVA